MHQPLNMLFLENGELAAKVVPKVINIRISELVHQALIMWPSYMTERVTWLRGVWPSGLKQFSSGNSS